MHTKRANLSTDPLQRFNDALRRPHTWRIAGIDAFWLEDPAGGRLTEEFRDTGPAYDAVLAVIGGGVDPEDILLVGRRNRGGRTVLGRGLDLEDIAEAHAGIPARWRGAME
jgi:hypothetical protein